MFTIRITAGNKLSDPYEVLSTARSEAPQRLKDMAMSSLSTLHPASHPHAARLGLVTGFAVLLVFLGFLVPFWIVLIVASATVAIARAVHAIRTASARVDQILAEELPPNGHAR